MVFALLMIVLDIAPKNEQSAIEGSKEDVFVVISANGNVVGHSYCFLAQQGSAPQLHQNKNAPQLVDEINTVLEILTPFAVFLKAFKAGFCLLDGLLYFTFDQIKRLRFRRERRLNHKRFPLMLRRLPHPLWWSLVRLSRTRPFCSGPANPFSGQSQFAKNWRTYHYL